MTKMTTNHKKEKKQVEASEEKKHKKRWLVWLLLVLLLAVAGGVAYYYFSNKQEPVQVVSGDYLPDQKDAKKMSDAELKKAEQKAVDASKFNMVIKSEATFPTGDSQGDLYIQNPVQNKYPIDVEIRLDDTNELIYSSGAMEPGYEVNGATLDKALAKGDYKATATFNIFDPTTKEKKGQVQAALTIHVTQ